MVSALAPRALLAWDEVSLRCDLDLLERLVNRELPHQVAAVREVRLAGEGPVLEVTVRVAWQGLPAQLVATITELRLHRRFLGCRVVSLRGPLGVPLPLAAVAAVLGRAVPGYLRLDPSDRILLVDLRAWLPPALDLGVRAATVTGRVLEVRLAPGTLSSLA